MASLKVFLFLSVLCVGAYARTLEQNLRSDDHNLVICDQENANFVAYRETRSKDAVFLGYAQDVISWPSGAINKNKITCILVQDQDNNGHGGYPTIVSGGFNYYDVEIKLQSQWGRGLNFLITIYTSEDPNAIN